MTQPAAPGRIEAFAEALFPVTSGPFRLMLGLAGLCAVVSTVFWGVGYAAELKFGFSVSGLSASQDKGVMASLLLVSVVGAILGGILGLGIYFLHRPNDGTAVTSTDPSVASEPAWWVVWFLTALAVCLGIIVWGGLYATNQWLIESRNLFVVKEVAYIIGLGVFVGVGAGILAAVVDGIPRLVRRARPRLVTSSGLWAFVCVLQWPLYIAYTSFLLWSLSLVARWVLLVFGVDTSITPASAVAGVLFCALYSLLGVALKWQELSAETVTQTAMSRRQDFWAWDLAPESSRSGIAATGYPFYVWRESADSRLGLSRPRYCVLADNGRELSFMFFDPSAYRQPTWGVVVGGLVAVFVTIIMAPGTWLSGGSFSFLSLFETSILAGFVGVLAGVTWHLGLRVLRWNYGRFERDGSFSVKPLRLLSGFNQVHAGEVGAKINGEEAKTGHGLTATFDDGSMIILTGNAWNYRSIVEHHSELTNAFRVPRDDFVTQWEAKQKKAVAELSEPVAPVANSSPDVPVVVAGVPEQL